MANFSTHLFGAVSVGIVATSLLAATDLLPLGHVAAGVGVVALGGIFPDVDSDYSDSIDLVFSLLGVTLGVPAMVVLLPAHGLLVALAGLGLGYVAVRYGVVHLFRRLTVHRGSFHSLPMAVLVSLIAASVAHLAVGADALLSWVFAALFGLGFLTHLVLDETYSVDLANRQIKRSFGTALKLAERERPWRYLLVYALIAPALWLAPSFLPVTTALRGVEIRLLPPSVPVATLLGLG